MSQPSYFSANKIFFDKPMDEVQVQADDRGFIKIRFPNHPVLSASCQNHVASKQYIAKLAWPDLVYTRKKKLVEPGVDDLMLEKLVEPGVETGIARFS